MASYPPELPIESIRILVSMLTAKADRNVQLAAYHAWQVQGYLQKILLGDPTTEAGALTVYGDVRTDVALSDAQGLALLGSLATYEQAAGDEGAVEMQGLRDLLGGVLRRQLAGLLLPLIQKWLLQFIQEGGLERLIDNILNPSKSAYSPIV